MQPLHQSNPNEESARGSRLHLRFVQLVPLLGQERPRRHRKRSSPQTLTRAILFFFVLFSGAETNLGHVSVHFLCFPSEISVSGSETCRKDRNRRRRRREQPNVLGLRRINFFFYLKRSFVPVQVLFSSFLLVPNVIRQKIKENRRFRWTFR